MGKRKRIKAGYIAFLLKILGKNYSKVVVLSPVRNITPEWQEGLNKYVSQLEDAGYEVYFPLRDTNQNDKTGLEICKDNRKAIKDAYSIHVAWDGKSEGVLFDLGMSFALSKKVIPITGYFPPIPNSRVKSFINMVWAWNSENYF